MGRGLILGLAVLLMLVLTGTAAQAATLTVGTQADTTPGTACSTFPSNCSLRQLIEHEDGLAFSSTPQDTIVVPSGSYDTSTGVLTVTQSVNIVGDSARTTSIQNDGSTIFDIEGRPAGAGPGVSPSVAISGLTIDGQGSAPNIVTNGASVPAILTLSQDTITGAAPSGVNVAGGIVNQSGSVTVQNSTVKDTSYTCVSCSGFEEGAGIVNFGTLKVTNATITGNTGTGGAGIISDGGPATVAASTIAENTDAATGSGPPDSGGLATANGGTISVTRSILAGNVVDPGSGPTPVNCGGAGITSQGYNLESGAECVFTQTGDVENQDPGFNSTTPADYGGATDTLAVPATSPAVDRIPTSVAGCTGTDQRGVARPQGSACDIGAYELYTAGFADFHQPTASSTVPAGQTGTARAVCPAGDEVSGGGFSVSDPTAGTLISSLPDSPSSWAVSFTNTSDTGQQLTVTASCISDSVPVAQIQRSDNFDGQTSLTAAADCPAGSEVLGGGFSVQDPSLQVSVSEPENNSTISSTLWSVLVENPGGSSATFSSVAICAATSLGGYEEPLNHVTLPASSPQQNVNVSCSTGGLLLGGGHFVENPPTQAVAQAAPSSAATWTVAVNNSDSSARGAEALGVCAVPVPAVSSVSPSQGPEAGGNHVTITGSRLTGVTTVDFGSTAASTFTILNDGQIDAVAPAGSGTHDITVTSAGGTSPLIPQDSYAYIPPPSISSVSLSSGRTAGGDTVTITGSNFSGASQVNFGSTPAAAFTVNSPSQIVATTPAHSSGTVDVTATTVGGTSATGSSDRYTFVPPPTVTSLSPTSGPAAGGNQVSMNGTGFTGATQVRFGSTPATSFTVNADNDITAVAPPGSGTVDITVTSRYGTSAAGSPDRYAYVAPNSPPPAPVVTRISPAIGVVSGGTAVTVTGTGFSGATAVLFGANPAPHFSVDSDGQLTATSPAGTAGTVDVKVTTPGGTSATSSLDRFTYRVPAPPDTSRVTATTKSSTAADVSATVIPNGAATSAHFEYGLDNRLRENPGRGITYDQRSPSTNVGNDFTGHALNATLSKLIPNALYHVRLVASNSDGTTLGPDRTFMTAKDPPPPPPHFGTQFNAVPLTGIVFVELPGTHKFIPVTEARVLPNGTIVDVRRGSIKLIISIGPHGPLQVGVFSGAIFRFTQTTRGRLRGLATLTLIDGAGGVCRAKAAADAPLAHAAVNRRILAILHARAKGRFRTRGRYAAGTIRGTTWDTIDRCDGTLIKVLSGSVEVQNLRTGKIFIVPAPGQLFIPAVVPTKTKNHR